MNMHVGDKARNTYKWWSTILDVELQSSLLLLQIPIYMAHGTADTSVPVESSDLVAESFLRENRTNLVYKRYEGLEHDWTDSSGEKHMEVLQDAIAWTIGNLLAPNENFMEMAD